MEINAIQQFIIATFKGSHFVKAEGDVLFMYGADSKFPFATIVTKDNEFDHVSNLDREDIFRFNIGVGKQTFQSLFGGIQSKPGIGGFVESGIDFTVTNKIMPHPVYGNMYWICVLNPSEETFQALQPYLTEAYHKAVEREAKIAKKFV